MIIKIIVVIVFMMILASLGTALFHLIKHKDREQSVKTARALTVRISLSLMLFIFVFIALAFGLFKPHGIGSRINSQKQLIEQNKQVRIIEAPAKQ